MDQPYQAVSVMTPGVTGANCFLQSGKMSYALASPGSVMVRRAATPMSVTCFKGNHLVGTRTVSPTVAPREAKALGDCESCNYPSSISVVLALNEKSLQTNVRHIR